MRKRTSRSSAGSSSRVLRAIVLASACASLSCGDPGSVGMSWEEIHTVCGTNTMIRGIDVSVYQGTIDWPAAARGGVRFAYMRLANNQTLDTTFVRNWTNSRAAGVLRGAYQYFNPHADAVAQANFVADNLMRNGFGPGDLPPMIDVEYPQSTSNPLPNRATYTMKVRQWLDTIRTRLGVDGVIYTGGYYWDQYLNTAEFAARDYWHAQYPNYYGPGDARNTIYRFDVTPLPLGGCPTSISNHWSRWSFWQFAGDNGRAPGVTGPVDNDAFNGTMDDLRRLARIPVMMDAGVADSGVARDASVTDTGIQVRDTGLATDAANADAGATSDTGVASDAGSMDDASSSPDSSNADSGTIADARGPSGADAAPDAGQGEAMRGGCGCTTPAHTRSRATPIAIVALALAFARRKRAPRTPRES
ncbi:MAG: hypothetical protein JNK05_23890 [Myxococcales bacterium]|nr:hypothetical protein [Myxococcales bacterium]